MSIALPVEILLEPQQKAVLRQLSDENWTGIVATYAGEKSSVKHYGTSDDDLKIASVLYETHVGSSDVLKDRNGMAKVGFSGIIASAAVW